jgi:hypothetical protein
MPLGQQFSETVAVFGRHHAVRAGPRHEGRAVETAQLLCDVEKEPGLAAMPRRTRTLSRWIVRCASTEESHLLVVASPRIVNRPNAKGRRGAVADGVAAKRDARS